MNTNVEIQRPTPVVGTKVYTVHLLVHWTHENGHRVKATIRARQFNGTLPNYLGKQGDVRWSIGKIGCAPGSAFEYPIKPEKVYLSRARAGGEMESLIDHLIIDLLDAKKKVSAT